MCMIIECSLMIFHKVNTYMLPAPRAGNRTLLGSWKMLMSLVYFQNLRAWFQIVCIFTSVFSC